MGAVRRSPLREAEMEELDQNGYLDLQNTTVNGCFIVFRSWCLVAIAVVDVEIKCCVASLEVGTPPLHETRVDVGQTTNSMSAYNYPNRLY